MANPPAEWTVLSMLEWATNFFEEKEIRNPRLSIEWLLAHVLGVKRLDLYVQFDRLLSQNELDVLRPMVVRRSKHEPLQYIIGEIDFFDAKIKVQPGVLIPRPETEELVELILNEHQKESLDVLDIGTGSGCIPIALKKNRDSWSIHASDISTTALQIAKENAELNATDIQFLEDDLFNSQIQTTFDIIVSNPPYIHHDELDSLDDEVKNFEPKEALFCNSTQEMYSAIEKLASKLLTSEGHLYLELHAFHSQEVLDIFDPKLWSATILNDYGNKPRFLAAKKLK